MTSILGSTPVLNCDITGIHLSVFEVTAYAVLTFSLAASWLCLGGQPIKALPYGVTYGVVGRMMGL